MSHDTFTCVIEIPKGSRNKYEHDPKRGGIRLDRFVSASVVCLTDYGYIVETLAPDGEPLDALVCVSEPTFSSCLVFVKVIGPFKMEDEKGPDDHVVCVPCADPEWNEIDDVVQLPDQLRAEIGHVFSISNDLDPGRYSPVHGRGDRAEALETLDLASRRFDEASSCR